MNHLRTAAYAVAVFWLVIVATAVLSAIKPRAATPVDEPCTIFVPYSPQERPR